MTTIRQSFGLFLLLSLFSLCFMACNDDLNLDNENYLEEEVILEEDVSTRAINAPQPFWRTGWYTKLIVQVNDPNFGWEIKEVVAFEEFFDTYENCDCWTQAWLESNGNPEYQEYSDYCIRAIRGETPYGAICEK